MNILLAIDSFANRQGGPARVVAGWSTALTAGGIGCWHLAPAAPPGEDEVLPLAAAKSLARIRVVRWRSHSLCCPFQASRQTSRMIRDHAIDLVHVHGLWTPTMHAVCAAARAQGMPLVVSPHGMLAPWALHHRAWKKRLAWRLYQHRDLASAAVLHATSAAEAGDLRTVGLGNPVAVVANAITVPPWREPTNGGTPRTVLFLSRIHPVKGLLTLVAAWARLRPTGWRCVVSGPNEGGHLAAVQGAVREAGLGADFSFAGPANDETKWDLYRSADLFVLPTHSENFGLVVAEALACGVPVITTRGAPWRELETHQCGWWVEIGVEPLTAALHAAMALSDAERRDMGRRGRHLVEDQYSWPRAATRMKAVYEWVLHGDAPPASVGAAPCA